MNSAPKNDPPSRLRAGLARSTAVVGLQWGDEGKGKIIDRLGAGCDAIVRYNGGANAGHTVVAEGRRFKLHQTPSGVLHPGKLAVIGNGVVVDPTVLLEEVRTLRNAGVNTDGLRLSRGAHVVMPYHTDEDAAREAILASADGARDGAAIGTTRRGIGPAYADKAQRAAAVRVADLTRPDALREKIDLACRIKNRTLAALRDDFSPYDLHELTRRALAAGEELTPNITDTVKLLHDMAADGGAILFEGANGTLLDVDHGTAPYVTASSCSALGVAPGTGLSTRGLGRVLGVLKAYATRVGAGPFPTEQDNEIGRRLRDAGAEYGTTTGRPRRTGWLDLVAARYAARINECDAIALTLLDVLAGFDELNVCTAYRIHGETTDWFPADAADLRRVEPIYETLPGFSEDINEARRRDDLPQAARDYIAFIEDYLGVPARLISVGADREHTIDAEAEPQTS